MNRRILQWPHRVLKKSASPIGIFDESTKNLAIDLIDTCNVHMGVGLAAPQIGVSKRMIVIKPSAFGLEQSDDKNGYNDDYWVLINPVVEILGSDIDWLEGCLSFPGVSGRVKRKESCKISYMTLSGEVTDVEAEWPLAGGLQHECDHLDGITYIFRQSRGNRMMTMKKYNKLKKQDIRKNRKLKREMGMVGESL